MSGKHDELHCTAFPRVFQVSLWWRRKLWLAAWFCCAKRRRGA